MHNALKALSFSAKEAVGSRYTFFSVNNSKKKVLENNFFYSRSIFLNDISTTWFNQKEFLQSH